MTDKDPAGEYPGHALAAAFVFRMLESRGAFRRPHVAEAIRKASDHIPRRLIDDPRVATLSALRTMLDHPEARRDLRSWWR